MRRPSFGEIAVFELLSGGDLNASMSHATIEELLTSETT